ncbi:MAG: hypothetical protein WC828_04750 [Thermoleophilia bacterium]|jgi:hypothetical protein
MNKPVRRLFYVSVIMFASLILMLGYRQVIQASDLADNPQNTRKVFAQMRIERGSSWVVTRPSSPAIARKPTFTTASILWVTLHHNWWVITT